MTRGVWYFSGVGVAAVGTRTCTRTCTRRRTNEQHHVHDTHHTSLVNAASQAALSSRSCACTHKAIADDRTVNRKRRAKELKADMKTLRMTTVEYINSWYLDCHAQRTPQQSPWQAFLPQSLLACGLCWSPLVPLQIHLNVCSSMSFLSAPGYPRRRNSTFPAPLFLTSPKRDHAVGTSIRNAILFS